MGLNFDDFPGFQQIPFYAQYCVIQCNCPHFAILICTDISIKIHRIVCIKFNFQPLKSENYCCKSQDLTDSAIPFPGNFFIVFVMAKQFLLKQLLENPRISENTTTLYTLSLTNFVERGHKDVSTFSLTRTKYCRLTCQTNDIFDTFVTK